MHILMKNSSNNHKLYLQPPQNNHLDTRHPVVQQSCAKAAARRWPAAAAILSNERELLY